MVTAAVLPRPARAAVLAHVGTYVAQLRQMLAGVNRLIFAIDRRYAIYCIITETVAALPRLAGFVLGASLLGAFVEKPEMSWTWVLAGIAAYALYLAAKTVLRAWAEERWRLFRDLLATHLELRRVEHLARLDLGRLVDPAFIELTQLAMRRGFAAIEAAWNLETRLAGAAVALAVSAGVLLYLDPVIGVLAVGIALPNIAQRWFGEQKRRELDLAETLVRRRRDEAYAAVTSPRTAALMRFLRFTDGFLADYHALTGVLVGNVREIARFERRWSLIAGIATVAAITALGLYFSKGLVAGRYSYAEIGAIAGSLQIVAGALATFGWMLGAFEQERRNHAYLQDFFATGPLVDESGCRPIALAAPPAIALDRVSFSYPGRGAPAVVDVSADIRPGEKIALVGPNGSGKTTLLRLLARVYRPDGGRIAVDGQPLDTALQASWIAHMVMVTQAPMLPGMEIARALTGVGPEALDRVRLDRALALANADRLVAGLPWGLETYVGEEWPKGRGFSTGEQQRLALAAALYRFLEPNVFVAMFDEPTANCDAETKACFYEAITRAPEFAGKTVIVSLHDPLYLGFFDRVLQFEGGRLVHDLAGRAEIGRYRDSIAAALATDL